MAGRLLAHLGLERIRHHLLFQGTRRGVQKVRCAGWVNTPLFHLTEKVEAV